jgi:hypothetical protein
MDADDIDASTLKVLATKLAKDEAALIDLAARKEALQSAVDTARAKCASLYDPAALIDLIKSNTPEAVDVRLRLKAEIRKRVSRIDLHFFPKHLFPGAKEQSITATIHYVNGVVKSGWLGTKDQPSMLLHNLYAIIKGGPPSTLIERLDKELIVTDGSKVRLDSTARR